MPAPLTQDELIGRAMALAHDVWLESARTSSILSATGEPLRALPRLDYADAQRRAELGRKLLERAEAIDLKALPHELELTVRVAIDRAQAWKRQADWYWLVFDPLGMAGARGQLEAIDRPEFATGYRPYFSDRPFPRRGRLDQAPWVDFCRAGMESAPRAAGSRPCSP